MLNRIVLIGRLTKDPELRYTPNGKAVAGFTLAVDRPFKNQQGEREADFINIVVWGNQAENSANYLAKGKLAAVDGRLQIRSYDGQDGQRRWVTEVVADNVRFLSPKSSGDSAGPASMGSEVDFSDDDIPF
ncbi:MAG: single-stranded DNA-binding protein [Firmicutes bacterium HGW-Firmicutes-14]|nr:MAG: single-stranded DNA-binding protein [Firmicutes bacterium HGW-Firmicutes-14]